MLGMCRIPDNYPVFIRYSAFFVVFGIRPDNDCYSVGFRIITKLDLLGKMIGRDDWPCNLTTILAEDQIFFGVRPAGGCRGAFFLKVSNKGR